MEQERKNGWLLKFFGFLIFFASGRWHSNSTLANVSHQILLFLSGASLFTARISMILLRWGIQVIEWFFSLTFAIFEKGPLVSKNDRQKWQNLTADQNRGWQGCARVPGSGSRGLLRPVRTSWSGPSPDEFLRTAAAGLQDLVCVCPIEVLTLLEVVHASFLERPTLG